MPIRMQVLHKMLRTTFLIIVLLALVFNFDAGRNPAYAAVNNSCQLTWSSVSSLEGGTRVAAVSDDDVWAVGSSILHWDGVAWSKLQDLYPNGDALSDIAVLSETDVWAAGRHYDGAKDQTLVMHWDGTNWNTVPTPDIGTSAGIAALSPNSIWITGNKHTSDGDSPSSLHWDGTTWQVISMPFSAPAAYYGYVGGIAAISENDLWAVGGFEGTVPDVLMWHWDGTRWNQLPILFGPYSVLYDVMAINANDAWAVGRGTNNYALIAHWDGMQWSLVSSNHAGALVDLVGVSAGNIWAVGGYATTNSSQMLIEHWEGAQWNVVNLPYQEGYVNGLGGITAISATELWAVGTLILHGTLPCLTAKPSKPKLVSPDDLAIIKRSNPRFKWAPAANASWYEVIIKRGAKIVDQQFYLTDTQYVTTGLKRGSTYSWRVKACNSVGCRASRWWQFTIVK